MFLSALKKDRVPGKNVNIFIIVDGWDMFMDSPQMRFT